MAPERLGPPEYGQRPRMGRRLHNSDVGVAMERTKVPLRALAARAQIIHPEGLCLAAAPPPPRMKMPHQCHQFPLLRCHPSLASVNQDKMLHSQAGLLPRSLCALGHFRITASPIPTEAACPGAGLPSCPREAHSGLLPSQPPIPIPAALSARVCAAPSHWSPLRIAAPICPRSHDPIISSSLLRAGALLLRRRTEGGPRQPRPASRPARLCAGRAQARRLDLMPLSRTTPAPCRQPPPLLLPASPRGSPLTQDVPPPPLVLSGHVASFTPYMAGRG